MRCGLTVPPLVHPPLHWQGGALSFDHPRLLGIVNATPDSFSDGGEHPGPDGLVRHALRLVDAGADMIDVGGESTRPGAAAIPEATQVHRVVPVIRGIRAHSRVPISVDTTRAGVAAAALDAGADVVNDVSAGLDDDRMFALISERRAAVILMHRRVAPSEDRFSSSYAGPALGGDPVLVVRSWLVERMQAAMAAGVPRSAIAVDPGLGFGKSVSENLQIMGRAGEFITIGAAVLVGASRKSFVGSITGVASPRGRMAGSVAAAVAMYLAGVRFFRVHDVEPHVEALRMAAALDGAR